MKTTPGITQALREWVAGISLLNVLFARGENPKAIQRWLGHHRASFTLDTYVHLLDEELPEGLDVCGSDYPEPHIVVVEARMDVSLSRA